MTLASGEGVDKLARPDGVELLDVTTEELLARAPPPAMRTPSSAGYTTAAATTAAAADTSPKSDCGAVTTPTSDGAKSVVSNESGSYEDNGMDSQQVAKKMKENELKDTVADKDAVEEYLLKIKPGCDFITTDFDNRERSRATEKQALEKAAAMLEETPAYKNAEAEAHVDSFGDCKKLCVKDGDHVDCKACMAEVSVPGYCAGHSGTTGC